MAFNYRKELGDIDALARRRVVHIYEQADKILQKRLADTLSGSMTTPKLNATMSFVDQLMSSVIGNTKPEIEGAVKDAFVAGANDTSSRMKGARIDTAFEALTGAEKEQAIAIMQDHYLRFASTLTTVRNQTRTLLTEALKRQIRDKIAVGTLTGDSVAEISRDIRKSLFTPKGITGFVKSNGARMSLTEYSNTLTRTMIINSGTEGSRARMATLGVTVFQISEHGGGAEDAMCSDHQGKIYDTTGKLYPKPQESDYPPYHPNCRHVVNARPDLQF